VIQLSGQVVPIKLNAEKEGKAVAQKYGVHGFPTILFIDTSGKVAGKIGGYMPPDAFAAELTKITKVHAEFPKLEAKYRANPNDAVTAAKLASAYAGKGDQAQAERLLGAAEKLDPTGKSGDLATAYNAVGDSYQEQQKFDRAISLFRKAVTTGKTPRDIAYARVSIAACYLTQGKAAEAKPEIEAVLKMPNAPADMKEAAQSMKQATRGR
jgi:tetratricopeptide (TPR) repeat protein